VSGGDPMTGAQASYLTTLSEEARGRAAGRGHQQGGGVAADRRAAGEGGAVGPSIGWGCPARPLYHPGKRRPVER